MECVTLLIFPFASSEYLVLVTLLDFEGIFIRNLRSGRVGRDIGSEDVPKLCDTFGSICGLIVEAVGGSNWW